MRFRQKLLPKYVHLVVVLTFLFFTATSIAQPVVSMDVEVEEYGFFQANDFINCELVFITLTNLTDTNVELLFNFRVTSDNWGEILNNSTTTPLPLAAGQSVQYSNLSYPDLDTDFTNLPNEIYNDQTLQADNYTIICTAYPVDSSVNGPDATVETELFPVINPLPPLLISPGDGSNVTDPPLIRPGEQALFSWSAIDPTGMIGGQYDYIFHVVERLNEQPLSSAMDNTPIYTTMMTGTQLNLFYPNYADELTIGREYVWWVNARVRNCQGEYIELASPPWLFQYGYDRPVIIQPNGPVSGETIDFIVTSSGLFDHILLEISPSPETYTDLNGNAHFQEFFFAEHFPISPYRYDASNLVLGETYYALAQLKDYDNMPQSLASDVVEFTYQGDFAGPDEGDPGDETEPDVEMTPAQFMNELRKLVRQFNALGQEEIGNLLQGIIDDGWTPTMSGAQLEAALDQLNQLLDYLEQHPELSLQYLW